MLFDLYYSQMVTQEVRVGKQKPTENTAQEFPNTRARNGY